MSEHYTLAYSVFKNVWLIYRRGTLDVVAGPFKSRDAADKRLNALEAGEGERRMMWGDR